MNWLVSGGCGFIGTRLVADLLNEGRNSVRVVDDLSVGTRESLAALDGGMREVSVDELGSRSPGLELFVSDILDAEAMNAAAHGADVVVHLAANTGVGPSVEDPMGDCRANVIGTLNMLEAARRAGAGRFVFASSGAPVGEVEPPIHEELAPRPVSPYGASKLAGEGYCSAYSRCFGLEAVALRFGNVYGPGSGHKQSVVAKFTGLALAGETLEVYGDGMQTRDFIYIDDLVEAVRLAARVPGVGGEIFQIATSRETNLRELLDSLVPALVAAGVERPEILFGEPRQGDVMRNFSDTSKARRVLGWQARTPLDEGLARTVRFFVELEGGQRSAAG